MPIIGRQLSIDTLFDQAFCAYWGGNYQYVSRVSKEIICTCDNYIVYGRITVVLCSAVVYLMFLATRRHRKIEAFFGHYRNLLLICTLPLIIAGSYLNVFRPVSVLRIEEFNIITGRYVGGITVAVALTLIVAARKQRASGSP